MSRNNRVAALGLLAVLLWGAPSAVGQTAAEVERWFRQELARAATPLAGLKNIQLTYRVEKPSELTAAELAEVQREIAGKPDHPKRMIAERSERRLRDGDETERYTLYLRSPDEWRVGHDYLGTKYFDCAAVPGLVWGFSNGQLTLLDPAGGFPPARDYRELGITPKNDVARLRFGGLDLAHRWGLQITSASPQDGRWRLLRARDDAKDQSYFLFSLTQAELARTRFPLGDLTKTEVRDYARKLGLPVAEKPESQEICFVPDRDYAGYVERHAAAAELSPGAVVDAQGTTLATHAGVHRFTVGQRRGLGIGDGVARWVTRIDGTTGTVHVGDQRALACRGLVAEQVRWAAGTPALDGDGPVRVRIRHRHVPVAARLTHTGNDRVEAWFEEPASAVTPGQAAVFYRGDEVLGGGWIAEAL